MTPRTALFTRTDARATDLNDLLKSSTQLFMTTALVHRGHIDSVSYGFTCVLTKHFRDLKCRTSTRETRDVTTLNPDPSLDAVPVIGLSALDHIINWEHLKFCMGHIEESPIFLFRILYESDNSNKVLEKEGAPSFPSCQFHTSGRDLHVSMCSRPSSITKMWYGGNRAGVVMKLKNERLKTK